MLEYFSANNRAEKKTFGRANVVENCCWASRKQPIMSKDKYKRIISSQLGANVFVIPKI